MPHKNSWYIENRILFIEFTGELTVEELIELVQQNAGMNEDEAPVHSITDTTRLTKFPINLNHLTAAVKDYKGGLRKGWTVVITTNVLANFAMVIIGKFSSAKYKTVGNFDEALQYLSAIDPTLVPLIEEKQHTG